MPPGKEVRARERLLPVAAAAIACALAPGSAAAAAGAGGGALSPRLAELAKPSVRSLPPARQARLLSLARSGPGSLLRDGNRVLVDVRFDHGAAAGVAALRAAGAEVVNVSRRYQTVTVAAKPAELGTLAAVARVSGVSEVLTPIAYATCPSGATVSEGDSQLRAAEARGAFGVDGSGVTVGILSDSFDQATEAADGSGPIATHAAEDVASGDLPGAGNPCGQPAPVDVLEPFVPAEPGEEAADEGRGMAQIVHDLAPGAKLSFASAFNGEISFAENIERLAKPVAEGGGGAEVIADDVAYFDEPFFQDGPVAVAINQVTSKGADYFTAAGNDNLIDAGGHDIASWEAPAFRSSGSCPSGVPIYATRCMDFNPGSGVDRGFGISVEPESTLTVDLQWAQPWFGVTTDLDAYLLKGGVRIAESQYPNTNSSIQEPVEIFSWENTSTEPAAVELAINRCEAACGIARALANPELMGTTGGDSGTPRLKVALLENGRGVSATEYPESKEGDTVGPTIFGHAGAADAISVAAIRFNTTSEPERYSSRGPVTHYFGPVKGIVPAAPLATPETLSKPDVTATDCGVTTFFASFRIFPPETESAWHFCGTSAAAPHAAAVAALMLDGDQALKPAQVRGGLTGTASPIGGFGPDAVGAGLVNAMGAVEGAIQTGREREAAKAQLAPPTITITERPPALSRNRSPRVGFSADRPVSFACALDGGQPEPCSSPFAPSAPLADGEHGFVVTGVDAAGLTGTSETVLFRVDTTPPRPFFRKHPHRLIRTRHRKATAAFRFGASEEGVTFTCRVDGGLPRFCGESLVRRFRIGLHFVRVSATDAAGNVSRRPAVFRFRVERAG